MVTPVSGCITVSANHLEYLCSLQQRLSFRVMICVAGFSVKFKLQHGSHFVLGDKN